jgi:hypothetical protein
MLLSGLNTRAKKPANPLLQPAVPTQESVAQHTARLRENEEYVALTKGFRWQSPGLIKAQDRTLAEYRRVATLISAEKGLPVIMEVDMADNVCVFAYRFDFLLTYSQVNDAIIFPECSETQIENICQ